MMSATTTWTPRAASARTVAVLNGPAGEPRQVHVEATRAGAGVGFLLCFMADRHTGCPPAHELHWESSRGSGEIGRHAGFRFLCFRAWGFKSPLPHMEQISAALSARRPRRTHLF